MRRQSEETKAGGTEETAGARQKRLRGEPIDYVLLTILLLTLGAMLVRG